MKTLSQQTLNSLEQPEPSTPMSSPSFSLSTGDIQRRELSSPSFSLSLGEVQRPNTPSSQTPSPARAGSKGWRTSLHSSASFRIWRPSAENEQAKLDRER